MEENILLAELAKNCEGKREKLLNLLQAFDLACIGYDLQDQHSKDIHNRVLRENEFFAEKEAISYYGISKGDRITNEECLFLLSDKDFDKVMELSRPICVAEKLTDENGYFLENWSQIRSNARLELVTYLVYEIIPESLRQHFDICRWNIVKGDKLIDIFKKNLKVA